MLKKYKIKSLDGFIKEEIERLSEEETNKFVYFILTFQNSEFEFDYLDPNQGEEPIFGYEFKYYNPAIDDIDLFIVERWMVEDAGEIERKFDYKYETEKLWRSLKDKMEFGLKKYGAVSFQSSLENLEKCDVFQHLEEELIDGINYSMALIIKNRILKKKIESLEKSL